jgi:hypothetical protein
LHEAKSHSVPSNYYFFPFFFKREKNNNININETQNVPENKDYTQSIITLFVVILSLIWPPNSFPLSWNLCIQVIVLYLLQLNLKPWATMYFGFDKL